MKFSLHVYIPGEGVHIVWLDRDRYEVGRHPDSDIVLAGPAVSRCHALLRRTERGYQVEDLGGFNGVLVGGRRVQCLELTPGDEVVIGDNRLIFHAENDGKLTTGVVETYSPPEAQQPWPTLQRLREECGELAGDVELLLRAVAEIDGPRTMHDALAELASWLLEHLGADRVVWWLGRGSSFEAPLQIERHRNRTLAREPLDEGFIDCVARSGKPFVRRITDEPRSRSWIAAPIPLTRRPSAVLIAERGAQPTPFQTRDLELLAELARALAPTLHRWLEHEHLARSFHDLASENQALRNVLDLEDDFEDFVGRSPTVRRTLRRARAWVDNQGPVLIHGETGTGRRRLARLLHFKRNRAWGPLIAVCCALQPAPELDRQLFGTREQPGSVAAARGGSLLLLHLEQLPAELATPLAALVRQGKLERPSGERIRASEVRFLAVMSRPPANVVRRRPELTTLIELFDQRLTLPSLYRTRDDIPLVAEDFLVRAGRELGKRLPGIEPACAQMLSRQRWPGNRSELEALMRRCALHLKSGQLLATKHLRTIDDFDAEQAAEA